MAKFGETYWKRSHQMKGVALCPEHGEELIEVTLSHTTTGADFVNPTEATLRIGKKTLLNLNRVEKKLLLAIARRCRSMLKGQVEPRWQDADPSLYRTIAVEKGLCSQLKGCQHQIFLKFKEMFSDTVIRTFGLGNTEVWVRKIFFSHTEHAFPSVVHAVIQEFLSSVPGDSTKAILFGLGPWKCPNQLGQHKTSFPIKRVVVERDTHQNVFARTTCCCGYSFEFYTTEPSDPSMPVVHKVVEYGPSLEEEIRRMNSRGMDIIQIAFAVKVPAGKIIRILKGHSLSKNSTTSLRRQWSEVLNATTHHAVNEARRRNPRLYEKIKKSDPNYLSCTFPLTRHPAPDRYNEQHWKEKDAALSARLRAAAESILSELPPTRVSVRAILRRSGISAWSLRAELQTCHQVLREMRETSDAFQMRRLKYLAEKAKAQGIRPKRNQLFYEGHIRLKKDKKRLETYVDSLCE